MISSSVDNEPRDSCSIALRYRSRVGKSIAPKSLAALSRYHWRSGNIRELRNAVEQMVVLAERPQLTLRDVPRECREEDSDEQPIAASSAARSKPSVAANRPVMNSTSRPSKPVARLPSPDDVAIY